MRDFNDLPPVVGNCRTNSLCTSRINVVFLDPFQHSRNFEKVRAPLCRVLLNFELTTCQPASFLKPWQNSPFFLAQFVSGDSAHVSLHLVSFVYFRLIPHLSPLLFRRPLQFVFKLNQCLSTALRHAPFLNFFQVKWLLFRHKCSLIQTFPCIEVYVRC